jgi:hypothetical protein
MAADFTHRHRILIGTGLHQLRCQWAAAPVVVVGGVAVEGAVAAVADTNEV